MEPNPRNNPDRHSTMLTIATAVLRLTLVVARIIALFSGEPPM